MEKLINRLVKMIDETLKYSSYAQIAREAGVAKSSIWRAHNRTLDNLTVKTISKIFYGLKKIRKKA